MAEQRAFLAYDGRFVAALDRVSSAVLVNLLWMICCLPVVTIGAANAAGYATTRKRLIGREGHAFSTFRGAFAANFRQSTVIGLAGLPLVVASLLTASYALSSASLLLYTVLLAETIVCACVYFWCVPLAVRFENNTLQHLRNGLLLGLGYLGSTSALALGLMIIGLGFVLLPPVILVLPIVLMVVWSRRLEQIFAERGFVVSPEKQ